MGCKVELTSGLHSGWFWGFSAPFIGTWSSFQGAGSAPEFAAFRVSIWFGVTYCGIQQGVIVSPTGTLFFLSQLRGCYWHLVGRDQGHCSASYSAQDGPMTACQIVSVGLWSGTPCSLAWV